MGISYQTSSFNRQSQQPFAGIRFFLYGFDPETRDRASRRLFFAGAVDAGACSPDCTHVIVDNTIEYDDPVCVTARRDGKILVSEMWLKHSFEVGRPVLTDLVMYVPRRNLKGIPGAQSLVLMVQLMGAKFTIPLRTDTVTHLVCYKFEGQKYDLAARKKTIKLVNHKWLEDCLRKWEIVPEKDYSKSGYELEMEMELEAPRSLSNTIASRGFSIGAGIPRSLYSCSMLMRFCQQLSRQDVSSSLSISNAKKVVSDEAAGTNSKSIKRKSLGKNASLDDENGRFKRKSEVSIGCSKLRRISLDDDLLIRESSHVEGGQELGKNPQADSDAKSPARITSSKTILRNSSGLKGTDVPAEISYLNTSAAASPVIDTAFKTTRTKSPGFNCKIAIGDVAVSKTPTPEIVQDEDFDVVQRPQKNYRKTSLDTKVDKSDTGVAVTVMQGPVLTNSDSRLRAASKWNFGCTVASCMFNRIPGRG